MGTVISSAGGGILDLRELRKFGGLLRYLSLRDVFVRYKQTWAGFGWSVIRPVINIAIFGTISYLIDPSGGFAQRFVSVAAAVVFWQLISGATTEVSNSLSNNASILTKVYFPKIILPLSALLVSLVDFAIAFVLFLLIYIVTQGFPPVQFLLFPVAVIYALIFSFGLGLLAATASVRYRDIKFLVPFFMTILFYASPVVMTSSFVLSKNLPQWMLVLYQLNPVVLMLNTFKYSVFGTFDAIDPLYAVLSVAVTAVMVIVALRYFTKFERSFADYI